MISIFAALILATLVAPTQPDSANCGVVSKGFQPLPEMTSTYKGQAGGLYGGGLNTPPAYHDSAGLALGHSFVPLDSFGNAAPNGFWILLSVGMSNCTQEFTKFMSDINGNPSLNSHLQIVDGAQGGQTASKIAYDTAMFWQVIFSRLAARGLSAKQVQAVWLKEANAAPTEAFPNHAVILRDNLRDVVQILHRFFPNLRQVFLSSRIYGGYASTTLNPEPYAYEGGFAVRWLIQSQTDGNDSLNYDSSHGPVRAPWMAWGPYLWADGAIPRAGDSLQWLCEDLRSDDGTHPSALGQEKVAQLLQAFFSSSPYTKPWYLKGNDSSCCTGKVGNVNSSGGVDLADLSALATYLTGGPYQLPCVPSTDLNRSGAINVADLSALVSYLTGGGYVLPDCP